MMPSSSSSAISVRVRIGKHARPLCSSHCGDCVCVDRRVCRGLGYMCGLCNTCYKLALTGSRTRRSCLMQPNTTVSEPLGLQRMRAMVAGPGCHWKRWRLPTWKGDCEYGGPRSPRLAHARVSPGKGRLFNMGSRTGVCSRRCAVARPVFHFCSPVSSDGTREEDGQNTSSMRAHSGHRSTEICLISANQRGTQYGN